MKNSKIDMTWRPLKDLLHDVDMGHFAIPRLQREFVWDGPKAAKLFDSIYRGMPIGAILIWETPKNKRLYLRQQYHVLPAFDYHNPTVWFLIDGQQRISVLHLTKEGTTVRNARGRRIDFRRVVFSLHEKRHHQIIRYRKPIPRKFVELQKIFHPSWRHKVGYVTRGQEKKILECRKRILNYPMYLMFVDMGIDEVKECFLRINTQGMKITTADAIFTKAETLDLRDFVHEVKLHLDEAFQDIAEMPILWAFANTHKLVEARGKAIDHVVKEIEKTANHNRKQRRILAKRWAKLSRYFGKAADYLRQNFKVLSTDYLYSDYMLSMLALFLYWNDHGPSRRQRGEIRKWFWATEVGSRYSGSNFLRCIPGDIRYFQKLAKNNGVRFKFPQEADKIDIRKTLYSGRSGIACAFYSPLLQRGPVSIIDDAINPIPIDRYVTPANRKDRHHIFPKGVLRAAGLQQSQYNSICNICLLTSQENHEIGSRRPWSYLQDAAGRKRLFSKKMSRHLIPVDDGSGIWNRNIARGFKRFIQARRDLICRSLEGEAKIRLFRRDS
jgi:hypothetical protein